MPARQYVAGILGVGQVEGANAWLTRQHASKNLHIASLLTPTEIIFVFLLALPLSDKIHHVSIVLVLIDSDFFATVMAPRVWQYLFEDCQKVVTVAGLASASS